MKPTEPKCTCEYFNLIIQPTIPFYYSRSRTYLSIVFYILNPNTLLTSRIQTLSYNRGDKDISTPHKQINMSIFITFIYILIFSLLSKNLGILAHDQAQVSEMLELGECFTQCFKSSHA